MYTTRVVHFKLYFYFEELWERDDDSHCLFVSPKGFKIRLTETYECNSEWNPFHCVFFQALISFRVSCWATVWFILNPGRINRVINKMCVCGAKYRFVSNHLRIANKTKHIRENCVDFKHQTNIKHQTIRERENGKNVQRKENFFLRYVLWLMVVGVAENTCLFILQMVSFVYFFPLFLLSVSSNPTSVFRFCFSFIRGNFSPFG